MVTPPRLVSAILIPVGLLLVGCDGRDHSGSSCGGGYGDFSQLVPKNWVSLAKSWWMSQAKAKCSAPCFTRLMSHRATSILHLWQE